MALKFLESAYEKLQQYSERFRKIRQTFSLANFLKMCKKALSFSIAHFFKLLGKVGMASVLNRSFFDLLSGTETTEGLLRRGIIEKQNDGSRFNTFSQDNFMVYFETLLAESQDGFVFFKTLLAENQYGFVFFKTLLAESQDGFVNYKVLAESQNNFVDFKALPQSHNWLMRFAAQSPDSAKTLAQNIVNVDSLSITQSPSDISLKFVSVSGMLLTGLCFNLIEYMSGIESRFDFQSIIEQQKFAIPEKIATVGDAASNMLEAPLLVGELCKNVASVIAQAGKPATVKFRVDFEKAVNRLVGATAEVQFSSRVANGQETQKNSDKAFDTRSLVQFSEAHKAYEAAIPGVINDALSNAASVVLSSILLPIPPRRPTTVQPELKETVVEGPSKLQNVTGRKQGKSKEMKQFRNRQLGEEPYHRTRIETHTRFYFYNGLQPVDPSKYEHTYSD